ncbi:MAG: MBL fold metallo-hydrolase [Mycobacteriales bacterium]
MRIDVISTPDLGDRSYVVSDDTAAIVIDPQRDVDRVQEVLDRRGVPLVMVLETHVHNDYVTGGYALAQQTGATYVMSAADELAFDRKGVADGDRLTAGGLEIDVVETPGHTATHLAYVVRDSADPEAPPAVFTGGSLLYGSVGRTDLLGEDVTDALTRAQWRSARRLADTLPDAAPVYPTHGFGSFCSSGSASGGDESTIGTEKTRNDALTEDDEQAFVDKLVAGLTGYPAYYAHMGALNEQGPAAPDLSPAKALDPQELAGRIKAGEWVVDLRDRVAYAGRHLAGTVSIGGGDQFSTYVGWLIPWGAPVTLISQDPEDLATAQRQLVRIGIERLAGAVAGSVDALASQVETRSYRVADFTELAATPDAQILDVRRDDERRDGWIAGSAHIPLDQLIERLDDVADGTVWVHCASGYRASIAASILDRAGHPVVHINDEYERAVQVGLTTQP